MATVKEILDRYKLSGGADDVKRVEVIAPGQAAHVSDGGNDILVWDRYLDQTPPDELLQQVKDVRAMLPDPSYPRVKMLAESGLFMLGGQKAGVPFKGCDASKCVMFTDTKEFKVKLAAEIQQEADALEAQEAAEPLEERRREIHLEWMKTMAYKHLMNGREGPTSAINTYDGAIFTWGMGFGANGFLKRVLSKIHEIEKRRSLDLEDHHVQKLFYLCGFKFDGSRYWVVDVDAKRVYADGAAIAEAEHNAFRYIHDTLELHFMWTLAARDDLTRRTILDAQKEIFFAATGNVALGARLQTGALYTFLAHLQHWTGDTGLGLVDYAFSAEASPRVASAYPSEKADAEIAVQAVHRFYKRRSPDFDQNSFQQVRDYWSQMVTLDAKDEGTTDFNPSYAIMTAPPIPGPVPDGHLGGERRDGTFFDLGPCSDFQRLPDGTPVNAGRPAKPAPAPIGPPPPPGWIPGDASSPAPPPDTVPVYGPPLPPDWSAEDTPPEGDAAPDLDLPFSRDPSSWTF